MKNKMIHSEKCLINRSKMGWERHFILNLDTPGHKTGACTISKLTNWHPLQWSTAESQNVLRIEKDIYQFTIKKLLWLQTFFFFTFQMQKLKLKTTRICFKQGNTSVNWQWHEASLTLKLGHLPSSHYFNILTIYLHNKWKCNRLKR